MNGMNISPDGLYFIRSWEKLMLEAYSDQAGIWTIGYGTIIYRNGQVVRKGDTIDTNRAITEMMWELQGIIKKLNIYLQHEPSQHQFDALLSITYNIGTGGIRSSTLLRMFNLGGEIEEDYFIRWNKVTIDGKKVVSNGLTRRRKSEYRLFKFADYTGNTEGGPGRTSIRA